MGTEITKMQTGYGHPGKFRIPSREEGLLTVGGSWSLGLGRSDYEVTGSLSTPSPPTPLQSETTGGLNGTGSQVLFNTVAINVFP